MFSVDTGVSTVTTSPLYSLICFRMPRIATLCPISKTSSLSTSNWFWRFHIRLCSLAVSVVLWTESLKSNKIRILRLGESNNRSYHIFLIRDRRPLYLHLNIPDTIDPHLEMRRWYVHPTRQRVWTVRDDEVYLAQLQGVVLDMELVRIGNLPVVCRGLGFVEDTLCVGGRSIQAFQSWVYPTIVHMGCAIVKRFCITEFAYWFIDLTQESNQTGEHRIFLPTSSWLKQVPILDAADIKLMKYSHRVLKSQAKLAWRNSQY